MKNFLSVVFTLVFAAGLASFLAFWDGGLNHPWSIPVVVVFFFFVYQFDIKIPGLGNMNMDHVIAFPAVVLLNNPAVAGIAAAAGMLGSRLYRRGPRGISLVHAYDAGQVGVAIAAGGWFFLRMSPVVGWGSLGAFLLLLLSMAVASILNLITFAIERRFSGKSISLTSLLNYIGKNTFSLLLSAPFVLVVLNAISARDPFGLFLSCAPILIVVWALRVNVEVENKNQAIERSYKRLEFLQRLRVTSEGSLENETFILELLSGLKEFVGWDKELMLIFPQGQEVEPILFCLGGLPPDPHGVKEELIALADGTHLKVPRLRHGVGKGMLLSQASHSQIAIALATTEIVFGVLVVEREAALPQFGEQEAKFLDLALMQIARHIQDEILKRQLLATNKKLLSQTDYLSQILNISNLLKIHLDVQAILDRVAKGIRESMGFQAVLISLYNEEGGYFERIAQAGLDDRWEEASAVKPPADSILPYLQPKFAVGNCYFVGHSEGMLSPYDVFVSRPHKPREPNDWHPEDALFVPLMDRDNRLLGVFSVDEPSDGKIPSMETLQALEVLANQTVHALESSQIHAQIRRQAVLDGLTGLYNHVSFQESLAIRGKEHELAGNPYSVLMMDLDNFKDINDTFGHLAGDSVLKAVGQALISTIRKEDVAARYGGEEFAVLLTMRADGQARAVAERIRQAVEALPVSAPGVKEPIRVTLSIGMASYPQHGADHHKVLERADAALYDAKRSGKNRVCEAAVVGLTT